MKLRKILHSSTKQIAACNRYQYIRFKKIALTHFEFYVHQISEQIRLLQIVEQQIVNMSDVFNGVEGIYAAKVCINDNSMDPYVDQLKNATSFPHVIFLQLFAHVRYC